MAEGEPTVTYTVKEMLAVIDSKVGLILTQLAGKASVAEVDALTERLSIIELDLNVQREVNKKTRTLLFVGVPGFVGFAATVIGIASYVIK